MGSRLGDSSSQQHGRSLSSAAERIIAQSRSSPSDIIADMGEAVPEVESSSTSRSLLKNISTTGAGNTNRRQLSSFRRSSMMDAALMPMLKIATAAPRTSCPEESSEVQEVLFDVDKVTITLFLEPHHSKIPIFNFT